MEAATLTLKIQYMGAYLESGHLPWTLRITMGNAILCGHK